MGRRTRQVVLVLHVLCGVGWMGVDVALATLVVTGLTADDGASVATAYAAARTVIPPAVPVLAVGMLTTGVLLGLGTKWGLVRWAWVLTKLAIGIVLTVLVFVALLPGALAIPGDLVATTATESGARVRDVLGQEASNLAFPPFVSFTMLGLSLVLSVMKPWGRTRWHPQRSRRSAQGSSQPTSR
jgi:hypothetical protein